MKMRKLFAGIAAAATLLSGLALGAGAANAADVDPSELTTAAGNQKVELANPGSTDITIKGSKAKLAGHTFKYVRLGTYTYAKTAPAVVEVDGVKTLQIAGVSVETDAAAKDYLNAVLGEVDKNYTGTGAPKYFDGNPAGYIAENMNDSGATTKPQWSGTLRNFVTALSNNQQFKDVTANGTSFTVPKTITEDAAGVATFTEKVPQGLYVLVDVTANAGDSVNGTEGNYRASIPMVVGTKIVGTVSFPNADNTQTLTYSGEFDLAKGGLGVVDVKNDRPTIDKTITGVNDHTTDAEDQKANVTADGKAASAAVGDVINYQIGNVEIPSTVGYDTAKFPYLFKITDTLHKGQTYNNDAQVYVDKNADGELTDGEKLDAADYGLTISGPDSDDENTTIAVDLSQYVGGKVNGNAIVEGSAAGLNPDLIGKKIYVTYTATLNDDAIVYPDGSNDNGVRLDYSNNPGSESHGTVTPPDTQVFTGKFSLKKVNKQGKTLAGAKFTVTKNGKTLAFTGVAGSYKAATADANPTVTEVEVGEDGLLHLAGLEGTYTIKETQAPEGYSSLFLPEFQVTVRTTPIKSNTLIDNKWYMSSEADPTAPTDPSKFVNKANAKTTVTVDKQDIWKLVADGLVEGNVQVTNVTSVSELPKTGAAGIALFTIIGVLLAAVAAIVYMRSRATKRALRA